MPRKASTAKRSTSKKSSTRKTSRKKTSGAKGVVSKAGRAVKKVAANPKASAKKAASKVHEGATRARGIGEKVVAAGILVEQVADAVDSMAQGRGSGRTARKSGGRSEGTQSAQSAKGTRRKKSR